MQKRNVVEKGIMSAPNAVVITKEKPKVVLVLEIPSRNRWSVVGLDRLPLKSHQEGKRRIKSDSKSRERPGAESR